MAPESGTLATPESRIAAIAAPSDTPQFRKWYTFSDRAGVNQWLTALVDQLKRTALVVSQPAEEGVEVSTTNDSLLHRVQASYERLTSVASNLNAASDELGKAINALDESLKKLNLGIATWHQFSGQEDGSGGYWGKYIGYAKIGARWGIGLSRTSGNYQAPPEHNTDEEWLFNDAPRQLRIEAVEHIPAMIDALVKAAEDVVEKIRDKTAEAQQLADVLAPAAKPKSVPRNSPRRPPTEGADL